MRHKSFWIMAALAGISCARSTHAFTITPVYMVPEDWSPTQMAVIQAAITDWTSHVSFADGNKQNIPVNFYFAAAGTGTGSYLTQWQFTFPVPQVAPFPYSPSIAHYIVVNSDYIPQDSFDVNGPVDGKYDMFTA